MFKFYTIIRYLIINLNTSNSYVDWLPINNYSVLIKPGTNTNQWIFSKCNKIKNIFNL